MDWVAAAAGLAIAYLLFAVYRALREWWAPPPAPAKWSLGDVTPDTLATHSGYDWSKPTLIAVRGVVYDVTDASDTYGPGKRLAAYAGREVARALAKGSTSAADVGRADVDDCSEEELRRLEQALEEIARRFDDVGRVVAPRELTLEELRRHDGADAALPMLISIRGVVFDVSSGKQFYGPDGIYPFAGHEVARAFALTSTDVADCHDDLEGLGPVELDNLREWEAKFTSKYPIIGRVVAEKK